MRNSATRSTVQAWAAFDDFPDAIAVLGRDLRWLYANPAVEKVLGTASGELIGKKLGEIGRLPAETWHGWQRQCMNVLATGRASTYRLQSSAHAAVRHYCIRIVARRDHRGRIDGLLNIAGAVTERTEVERLFSQSETCGVEEQAAFLQREDALRGKAVPGQTPGTGGVKDDALARLSHELRTPLNAILGWTQMLQSGADEQTVARALKQIEESAKSQARLIDDLLNLSGKGRTRLDMRAMEGDNASSASAPWDLHRAFAQRRSLAGLRILAVDDDRNTRDMLREVLARAGADVRAAGSAREALDKLKRYRPDVLLSDIGMPEQDGRELLHQVRVLPAEKGGATPAIAITGYARADDRAATRAAGYQAVVTKPVNLDDLVVTILDVATRA